MWPRTANLAFANSIAETKETGQLLIMLEHPWEIKDLVHRLFTELS